MSRKKAKMLFWAALVVLAYIPTSCSPPATPSCSFRIRQRETPQEPSGRGAPCAHVGCGERLVSCSRRPPSAALRRRRAARDSEPSRGLRGRFIAEWKTQRNPLNSPKRGSYFTHPFGISVPARQAGTSRSNGGKDAQRGAHRRAVPARVRARHHRVSGHFRRHGDPDSALCRLPGHHRAHHGGYLQHDVHLPPAWP